MLVFAVQDCQQYNNIAMMALSLEALRCTVVYA